MCGIAGAYSIGSPDRWLALVEAIVASQIKRGPDFQAIEQITWQDTTAILGHDRLSIIDLSAQGNQPMWDSQRKYCIIFNGEIYNYRELKAELAVLGHRFTTQSDTEVVLTAYKQWGAACVQRFNGMFALALLDTAKHELWLYRDRFGVKPFYYYLSTDTLLFASTGTAIAKCLGLQPDLDYVANGLKYGVYEDNTSISPYLGLKALPPAHWMLVSTSRAGQLESNLCRYYDLKDRVLNIKESLTLSARPLSAFVDQVTDYLQSAIEIRLRADVPVGIALSGGLDSSSIAAYLAQKHDHVTGFTFGHPHAPESEGPLVQELCKKLGIETYYVWPQPSEIIPAFWKTLEAQDSPFQGGSMIAQYLTYAAARASGIKVLLGGQGGDELFMGYRKYQLFYLSHMLKHGQYREVLPFALGTLQMLAAELSQWMVYWRLRQRYLGDVGLKSILKLTSTASSPLRYDPADPLWLRQLEDIVCASLPTLLRYEDRNSMSNSIESRLPFMDYRLVELAVALPEALKVRDGYGKWLLRQVIKGKIPESIRAAQYKRGFDVKQHEWVDQGLGQSMRNGLHEREKTIRQWLGMDTKIDIAFSDLQLKKRTLAFAEAATLLWLGDRTA